MSTGRGLYQGALYQGALYQGALYQGATARPPVAYARGSPEGFKTCPARCHAEDTSPVMKDGHGLPGAPCAAPPQTAGAGNESACYGGHRPNLKSRCHRSAKDSRQTQALEITARPQTITNAYQVL